MLSMAIITASVGHTRTEECIQSWGMAAQIESDSHRSMLQKYQDGYRGSSAEILAYFHDDLLIRDPEWASRVLAEFDDPTVGLVGFGGARHHGHPDLYKRRYNLQQLARRDYLSNVDDAEAHGSRFTRSTDVAVLDGYALIVRRQLLDLAGGWPLGTPINYSLYDYWLCAVAHRYGYRIRCVGVRCHHYGGMTAVGLKLADSDGMAHVVAHRWLYDHFADVLPYSCPPEVLG